MNKTQAELKAVETSKLNNRLFKAVPVTYMNGEEGWDVTPHVCKDCGKDLTQLQASYCKPCGFKRFMPKAVTK